MTTRRKPAARRPAAEPILDIVPNREWKPDDDEIAAEIAAEWRGKTAFFHGAWHVYENGVWLPRVEQQVTEAVRGRCRKYRNRGISVTYRLIRSIARLLEGDLITTDAEISSSWKSAEKYVPLQNGLFNLETFQLEPHRPELHLATQLDFAYDASADCPNFRRFLKSSLIDDEGNHDGHMAALVFEAIGYSLTAKTDMKASFWLIGKPDSGKSTLIGFLRSLMGSLHGTIDLNKIGGNQFILSAIVGKRMVSFTEADPNTPIPDALYKAMVGGTDEIWADVKNRTAISFVPQAKFWWAMNETPRVLDRSGATTNRLIPILFDRSIPKSEQIVGLKDILAQERAGVFNVAMAAYKNLLVNGKFRLPLRSSQWIANYKLENDTEQTFINEMMIVGEEHRIQSGQLYRQYKWWCEENGFRPKNANQIVKDWERLGFRRHRTDGRTIWTGLREKESVQMA